MFDSIKLHFKAFAFLRKEGLSWLLWFPFLVTILVIVGGFSITSWVTESISALLQNWLDSIDWLSDWSGFIGTAIYWLLWIVLRIALYFLLAFVGGSIILLLMSPILTYVSEKVSAALGAKGATFSITQFFSDLTRAIGVSLRNGLIQVGIALLCFVIGFIPVIGVASPFLLFAASSYFYGYSFLDYSLERQQISVSESNRLAWKHRFVTTGLGAPFALWMLIPFIGPMTSGFVALLATVAATIKFETGIQGGRLNESV